MGTTAPLQTHKQILARFFKEHQQVAVDQKLFPHGIIGYSSSETGTIITPSFEKSYNFPKYSEHPDEKFSRTENSLFDIASLTKSIIATIALRMIDRGELTLGTRIASHLGLNGKYWKWVTLKHLLTNSLNLDIEQQLHFLHADDIRKIIVGSNVIGLGNNFYYHNTTSIILGWFLEKFTCRKIEQLVEQEITTPANMEHTYFWSELKDLKRYSVFPTEDSPLRGIVHTMPHDEIAYNFAKEGQHVGCSGIFSTAQDMLLFGKFLFTNAFKNPEKMLAEIQTNHLARYGRTFGLGFDFPAQDYLCPCFAKDTLVATGYTGCALFIQPKHGEVLVHLSNSTYPTRGLRGVDSPLKTWRKELVRKVFYCKACLE